MIQSSHDQSESARPGRGEKKNDAKKREKRKEKKVDHQI